VEIAANTKLRHCKACNAYGHTAINCRKKNIEVIVAEYKIAEKICRFPGMDAERVAALGSIPFPPVQVARQPGDGVPFDSPDCSDKLINDVAETNSRQLLDSDDEDAEETNTERKPKSVKIVLETNPELVNKRVKNVNTCTVSKEGSTTSALLYQTEDVYCYCQQPWDGTSNMIGCSAKDKCKDIKTTGSWFHVACAHITEEQFLQYTNKKAVWYCPGCVDAKSAHTAHRKKPKA